VARASSLRFGDHHVIRFPEVQAGSLRYVGMGILPSEGRAKNGAFVVDVEWLDP